MVPWLHIESLTYDGIGDFITSAVETSEGVPLFLLGRAAAYIDIAAALGRVTRLEAMELRTMILVHASINGNLSFEYFEDPQADLAGSPIKPR